MCVRNTLMPYKDKDREREYQKKYRPIYYQKNKENEKSRIRKRQAEIIAWFVEYKKTKYCVSCNEKDWRCLDFHHTDPSKKSQHISRLVHFHHASIKKILEEIEKCIVLCANCHRKRTVEREDIPR